MPTMITEETSREELIRVWHENLGELVDAFIEAGIDPDDDATPTSEIYRVIARWIEDGDECAAA